MAVLAFGLAGLMVDPVTNPVTHVGALGIPPQVLEAVVVLDVVPMTTIYACRTQTHEGFKDKQMDTSVRLAIRSGKSNLESALIATHWLQDTAANSALADRSTGNGSGKRPDTSVVGDFVQAFPSNDG